MNIGRSIHILSRQVKRKIDEAVNKYNVTSVQCGFIEYISHESKKGNVYAKNIERKFNMRRATVAEILSLMEKNGLIERKSNESDGRLKQIILTDKSLEIKNNIKKEMDKVEKEIKQGLTEDEISKFMWILNKMSENLEHIG